jgi:hypothetical protein
MLPCIWDVVVELSNLLVEAIVLLEDGISQPDGAIGTKQLSVQVVSDSASILHFTNHVLDGIPRVWAVGSLALSQVLVDEEHGCLKISVVELIWNTEAKWSELSSLLHA